MSARKYKRKLRDALEERGFVVTEIRTTKHSIIECTKSGISIKHPVSTSPTNPDNAVRHALRDIEQRYEQRRTTHG